MSKKDKIDDFIDKNIISENLEDILGERFGRYSKYIIQDRALPDVRDGLKPVQRRILYAMYKMGMASNKPYKKSARIAGEVMGKYHPHGDLSIYDAMVRLSQPWKQGVCLIDMHGNNGSIDGDSAAAMRYTEARLTREAESLLEDIDKRTVLFVPNFDDEELEPTVLPAKFPNLLVNGGSGISAGYATKIPPHNLKEVIEATIRKIDSPNMMIDTLLKIMPGPDFPTGGIVQGHEGIKEAFLTGRGRIIVRSKIDTERISKDTYRLVVTEIPYEVNKSDLVRAIDNLRIDKKLEDIAEVRDESDKEGLRIAVDLKRDSNVDVVLNYLLKNTDLQVSFNYNMVAINNHRPVTMGVLDILDSYINHQKEVITNRSNYELARAEKRLHIVQGLIKMVDILDDVIKIIRNSKNKQNSKDNLMKTYGFTDLQAEAIVTLQLYRLSSTDINALIKEHGELEETIVELQEILSSETRLLNVIKSELRAVSRQLGEDRKTVIEEEIDNIRIDKIDLIAEETVHIGITKDGYIKRSNLRSYRATTAPGLKPTDGLMFDQDVSTHDTLLMFTTRGNYIYMPVFELEESRWGDLGTYIANIIPMNKEEMIIKVITVRDFDEDKYILLATKDGQIKQTKLKDFEVSRYSRLIRAMNVGKNDRLASADMGPLYNVICFTSRGQALRFSQKEVSIYGTQSSGIKSMRFNPKDKLVKAIYAKSSDDLLILSSRGFIKREPVDNLPLNRRLRASVIIWSERSRNPHFIRDVVRVSRTHFKENATLLLTGKKGSLSFTLDELKPSVAEYGREHFRHTEYGQSLFINIESVDEPEDKELLDEQANDVINSEKETIEIKATQKEKDNSKEEKPLVVKEKSSEEIEAANDEESQEKIKITKLSLFDEWEESDD